jgi:hypothetical protein
VAFRRRLWNGAAVAGAVVAVKAASGSDDTNDGGGTFVRGYVYSVMIPLPGLDVSPCGTAAFWTSQNVPALAATAGCAPDRPFGLQGPNCYEECVA